MLNKSPHFANYGAHHLLGSCDQTCWIAGVLFRSGDKKLESLSMKSCSFPEFPVDFYGSWLCCDRIRISSDIHLKLQFAHCLAPPHGLKDFETWCFCLNLSGSDECFFQPSAARQDPTSFPHRTQCKLLKR